MFVLQSLYVLLLVEVMLGDPESGIFSFASRYSRYFIDAYCLSGSIFLMLIRQGNGRVCSASNGQFLVRMCDESTPNSTASTGSAVAIRQ